MRRGLITIMRVQGAITGHHDRFASMLDRAAKPRRNKRHRQRRFHAADVQKNHETSSRRVPTHPVAKRRFKPDDLWADSVDKGRVMVRVREDEGHVDLVLPFAQAHRYFIQPQEPAQPTSPQYQVALDHVLNEVLLEDAEATDIDGPIDGLQMTKRLMHHSPRRRNKAIDYDS